MSLFGGSKSSSKTISQPTVADNAALAVGAGATYSNVGFTSVDVGNLLDFLKTHESIASSSFQQSLGAVSQAQLNAASPAAGSITEIVKQLSIPIAIVAAALVAWKVLR